MLSRKTCRKRTKELNDNNFPSEAWFNSLLKEYAISGFLRNPALLQKYFGDFVWFSHMVVVEIDGSSHLGKEDYDNKRDRDLELAGYRVFRINAGDTMRAFEVIKILQEILLQPAKKKSYINKPRLRKKKKSKVKRSSLKMVSDMVPFLKEQNAKMVEDLKRRKALWIHPRKRAKLAMKRS